MRVSCPKSFSLSIHFTEVELTRNAVLNAECVEYFSSKCISRAREGWLRAVKINRRDN